MHTSHTEIPWRKTGLIVLPLHFSWRRHCFPVVYHYLSPFLSLWHAFAHLIYTRTAFVLRPFFSQRNNVSILYFMFAYIYVCLLEFDAVFSLSRYLMVLLCLFCLFFGVCLILFPNTQCTKNAMHIWSREIWTHISYRKRRRTKKNGNCYSLKIQTWKKRERKKKP